MKNILIIDDASTVRLYHRNILEASGYEVDEATNGVEALEKALSGQFDLFIVDINMPKMNGYEFLQNLRKENITQSPAVMVSTEAADLDHDQAFYSGANLYLVKPIKPLQLMTYVRLLMGEESA
ncbi:MAG: response regulator [Saccharospirillaceae bacterium]|nr:response regulator [Saccharospirillaceae bacterium]MCD8531490.1 response regulator [Saccharospirillaceae bacterium]